MSRSNPRPVLGSVQPITQDWGLLAPGQIHTLSVPVHPTPQSILDGSYQRMNVNNREDVVTLLPRRPEFLGPPSVPSILFSVNGRPGPYIRDILREEVEVDSPFDQVFYSRGWRQTWIMIDWPGTDNSRETLGCMTDRGPLTRSELAKWLSFKISEFIVAGRKGKLQWGPQRLDATTRRWDLREVSTSQVRLMGLNYYKNTWIPVLAFDWA
ncbi:hypothetical protein CC1G_04857 [Coprinopsis cinerea okayama7|uniref:Uncharacterized protein n=1 Tax=Coprinopsis cinerea (strain Okayama-7 / 130 / ATCC MYA-4618 / FGSC 9003) TaxID=240176 RepID=A8PFU0_COPC7|nr:hypothetical protein CC1G_04857 [Coprinopsis cinerea okayama7\|eukprot:XP_001841013.2 hypothetical protein CC1G_04857 [Coprinopsis cinerea okayama7\